ncbi:glucosamine-6-phosphate deaminase [bacterium Unc6]|nr:glucosamine-6-phosphate deaminase [bacterium Unc6]
MNIIIVKNKQELGKKAASVGTQIIKKAIKQRGYCNVILATGLSQFQVLENLLKEDINWNKIVGFHLDEYIGLPIAHPASFRLYLWKRFISRLPFPLNNFYFINADVNPETECARLGEIIKKHPVDVAFIGIGENGHIAFNDPPADFKTKKPYIVVQLDKKCKIQQYKEGWFKTIQDVPGRAISMSVQHILKSKTIICCAPDKRKAEVIRSAIKEKISPDCPASALQKHPDVYMYLDKESASLL